MNLRSLFILCAILTTGTVSAQTPRTKAKVGVNTQNPTENLHVNGTLRVQKLPADKEANAIGTKDDGTGSTGFDQTFNARYIVTADKNGVLGRASGSSPSYFYMPALYVPTKSDEIAGSQATFAGGVFTINLYTNYAHQFGGSTKAGMPALVKSNSSATLPQNSLAKTDFDYFVTYFDDSVFEDVAVNTNGQLTYKVKAGSKVTGKTFMNIVFKKK